MGILQSLLEVVLSGVIAAIVGVVAGKVLGRKFVGKGKIGVFLWIAAIILAVFAFFGVAYIYSIFVPKVVYSEGFEKGLGRFFEAKGVGTTRDDAISGDYSLKIESDDPSSDYYGTRSDGQESLFRLGYNYSVSFKYRIIEKAESIEGPEKSHFYFEVFEQKAMYKYQCGVDWNGSPKTEGSVKVHFKAGYEDLRFTFGLSGRGAILIDNVKVIEKKS